MTRPGRGRHSLRRSLLSLRPHAAKAYHDKEVPEVVIMTNLDANGNYDKVGAERGVGWHVDGTFQQDPTKATILHSVALPDHGGNTAFANMYLAWDTMPEALKRRIDGLTAIHRLRGRKAYTQGIVSDEEMKRMIVSRDIYPVYERWFRLQHDRDQSAGRHGRRRVDGPRCEGDVRRQRHTTAQRSLLARQ